jgi:catechol 2,3-dioxygenase-like lactoylglutathione lyase family enzyme
MIDHMMLSVRDLKRSRAFYEKLLAPLGYGIAMEFGETFSFGPAGKPVLWMKQGEPPPAPQHIAFAAPDRASVDAFHSAAIAAGGEDNGAPGLRPHYHASYYAAFVNDPDGYALEAVNHGEQTPKARPAAKRSARRTPAGKAAGRKAAGRGGKRAAKNRKAGR